jgi:hypothetical protein
MLRQELASVPPSWLGQFNWRDMSTWSGRIAAPSCMASEAALALAADGADWEPGSGSGKLSISASNTAGATGATAPTGSAGAAGAEGKTGETSGGKDREAMVNAE